jgi:hypothetical protein
MDATLSGAVRALLVELFVEELPPKSLRKLGEAWGEALREGLRARALCEAEAGLEIYASPRRLAARVGAVRAQAPDRPVSHKLMPVAVGLDAQGQPSAALLKRLAALGFEASAAAGLRRVVEGKSELLYLDTVQPGATLATGLQQALEEAVARLPIPKMMRYQLADGWTSVDFVRPAHGLSLGCRRGAARVVTASRRPRRSSNWPRPPTTSACWPRRARSSPRSILGAPRSSANSPRLRTVKGCSRCRTTPCWKK